MTQSVAPVFDMQYVVFESLNEDFIGRVEVVCSKTTGRMSVLVQRRIQTPGWWKYRGWVEAAPLACL